MRSIIHPRHYESQRQIYRLLCTIEESTESQAANNEVVDTWTAVPSMTALPCTVANIAGTNTVLSKEKRKRDYTAVMEHYQLSFTRLLPGLEIGMRARVATSANTTEIYNILGVDHDSQGSVTRARCEKVGV